jgi:hypothetical protein
MTGDKITAPEIKIKIKDHNFDFDVIFRSSVINAFLSLKNISLPEFPSYPINKQQ